MQNKNVCFYKNNQDEKEVRSSTLKLLNYEISSHALKRWSALDNSKIKIILLDKNNQLEKKRAINHVSITSSKK